MWTQVFLNIAVCRECKMFVFCLLTFSLLERATGDGVSTTLSTWAVARETAEPLCACPENNRSILVENAKKMTEMTKNKTIINKIKHRVTHSNDAIWASICLSFIFVLIGKYLFYFSSKKLIQKSNNFQLDIAYINGKWTNFKSQFNIVQSNFVSILCFSHWFVTNKNVERSDLPLLSWKSASQVWTT